MSTTTGFDTIYIETHDWRRSVAFWQTLGFRLDFETDHNSGQLVAANGTRIFLAEQPLDDPLGLDFHLSLPDASFAPGGEVDVVQGFTPTHWGTQIMTVRDPDGRLFRLEAPSTP